MCFYRLDYNSSSTIWCTEFPATMSYYTQTSGVLAISTIHYRLYFRNFAIIQRRYFFMESDHLVFEL